MSNLPTHNSALEELEKDLEKPRGTSKIFLEDIKKLSFNNLQEYASNLCLDADETMTRQDIIISILKKSIESNNDIIGTGVLQILSDGFGFLRSKKGNYLAGSDDIYVSPNQIKKFSLRNGDILEGHVRSPKKGEKYFGLLRIEKINDMEPFHVNRRVYFDDLTPIYPTDKFNLEFKNFNKDPSTRIMEIFCPIGKGQRALIVAPPRTGKTILLQNIAHAITENHPEVYLIVLLVGERPEEVTDMTRSVNGNNGHVEVVSSTFDETSVRHVQLAELVIEKAKRLVEAKKDVVILLDSITRLARAYNDVVPSSGKVLTGGVDSNALQRPKKLFGAARNLEENGSLTIIATALVDTGSRMDEVIFEEFKGTGNCEIVLDRRASDRRLYPAIDITKSGTRKEADLVDKATLSKMWILRRITNQMGSVEGLEFALDKIKNTKCNIDFFESMNS